MQAIQFIHKKQEGEIKSHCLDREVIYPQYVKFFYKEYVLFIYLFIQSFLFQYELIYIYLLLCFIILDYHFVP